MENEFNKWYRKNKMGANKTATKWLYISIGCIVLAFVSMFCIAIPNNVIQTIMSWLMIFSFEAFFIFLIIFIVAKNKLKKTQEKERERQNTPYERLKRTYEDCIIILENYYQEAGVDTDRYEYVAFVKENEKWKIAYQITSFHPGYRPDGGGCAIEIPEELLKNPDHHKIAEYISDKTRIACDLSNNKPIIDFCEKEQPYPYEEVVFIKDESGVEIQMSNNIEKMPFIMSGYRLFIPNRSHVCGYGDDYCIILCKLQNSPKLLIFDNSAECGSIWLSVTINDDEYNMLCKCTDSKKWFEIYWSHIKDKDIIYHLHPQNIAQVKHILPNSLRTGKVDDQTCYGY